MSTRSSRFHRPVSRPPAALHRRALPLAVGAALAAGLAPCALAQDDIETIVVTATRRAMSVQDIPLNIAAFDGSLLAAREVSDLAELGRNVPGLYVVDQGKRSANNIVVRGLNVASFQSSEFLGNTGGTTVATYVGEVPMYVDLTLNDVDRVEVLLGPQGTLYGSGTLGGAIRFIPRKPQFDATDLNVRGGTFMLSESDDVGWRGGATFNMPLTDNLALRASIDRYDDPGFIDTPYLVRQAGVSDPEPNFANPTDVAANLYRDEDVNTEETNSAHIALRWQPGDRVDATFNYFYQQMEVGGRTQNHARSFGTGLYEAATRFPEPNDRTNELLSAEIIADLGFAELTSATGFAKYDELGQRDQTDLLITLEFSYEAFPAFSAFTRETEKEETLSQEIRLVSKGTGKLSWIGGLFFLDHEQPDGVSREFTPGYAAYLGTVRPDNLEYISVLYEDRTEKGLFGEVGYQITDAWQVTVGARYYDYEYSTLSGIDTPLFNTFLGAGPNEINLDLERDSQEDSGSLFKLNTSYDFSEDVMGYVTISEGFRIGASNGVAACPSPLPPNQQLVCALPDEQGYFADTTTNFEVGVRSQWLDRRLTLNAALYHIDWEDPQLTSSTANGNQPITRNGGGAQSDGLEVSIDAQIGERLNLGFSYAHTQAELTEVAPDLLREFIPPGFGPSNPAQYVDGQPGDRLPGSPEDQATLYVAYDWALGSRWDLTLNYGVSAIGDVISKTGQRAGGEKFGGYSVHHASVVFSSGPWAFTAYAQNLLDKYAVTSARSNPRFIQTVADENGNPVRVRSYAQEMLRPREIGFRFTYDFDTERLARRGN